MNEPRPLFKITARVADDMIDYNGHMGVAHYALLFDRCAEAFFEELNLGRTSAESGRGSLFSLEHHTTFLREVLPGTDLTLTLQLLDWDEKRIHYFITMADAATGVAAATSEQLAIHVDMGRRKSEPLPAEARRRIAEMWPRHAVRAAPSEAGHTIRIRRKRLPADE